MQAEIEKDAAEMLELDKELEGEDIPALTDSETEDEAMAVVEGKLKEIRARIKARKITSAKKACGSEPRSDSLGEIDNPEVRVSLKNPTCHEATAPVTSQQVTFLRASAHARIENPEVSREEFLETSVHAPADDSEVIARIREEVRKAHPTEEIAKGVNLSYGADGPLIFTYQYDHPSDYLGEAVDRMFDEMFDFPAIEELEKCEVGVSEARCLIDSWTSTNSWTSTAGAGPSWFDWCDLDQVEKCESGPLGLMRNDRPSLMKAGRGVLKDHDGKGHPPRAETRCSDSGCEDAVKEG